MHITKIKSLWHEPENFELERTDIGDEYIFLHYLTPVTITLNGEEVAASPGSCILYNKNSYQKFLSKDCELVHDWFHLKGNLNSTLSEYGFNYNTIYTVSSSNEITEIIKDIESEFLMNDVFNRELIELKIKELILKILRSSGTSRTPLIKWELRRRFLEARHEISAAYNEDWTVKKMAELVHLSQSRFYKVYHDIFSVSPKKDLQLMRIEHAKMLLQNRHTVSEVAQLTGYANPYHFIRQFKKLCGETPKKWKDHIQ